MLEINPNHPIIVKLNLLWKTNQAIASLCVKQLVDNVFISSGIPMDLHMTCERTFKILDDYLG